MKINQNSTYLYVRWPAPSDERLRQVVDELYRRRLTSRWSSAGLDIQKDESGDADILIDFHTSELSSMRHFRVCHRNEGIWQILASAGGRYDEESRSDVVARYKAIDLKLLSWTRISFVTEGPFASDDPNDPGQMTFRFGWRTHYGPPGYYLEATCSNYRSCAAARYGFMKNALESLRLEDIVHLVGDEREYILDKEPGWSFYDFEEWSDKRSPSFFPLGPFPTFDDVWRHAEHFLDSPLGKKIGQFWVGFCANPEVYETLYPQFNELANDWVVRFSGSYADGLDPYAAEASASPNGRFPIFDWSPARKANHLFYQADIVPTLEGRFLEIVSNCGDMKKLLAEAEKATGVKFASSEQLPASSPNGERT